MDSTSKQFLLTKGQLELLEKASRMKKKPSSLPQAEVIKSFQPFAELRRVFLFIWVKEVNGREGEQIN